MPRSRRPAGSETPQGLGVLPGPRQSGDLHPTADFSLDSRHLVVFVSADLQPSARSRNLKARRVATRWRLPTSRGDPESRGCGTAGVFSSSTLRAGWAEHHYAIAIVKKGPGLTFSI